VTANLTTLHRALAALHMRDGRPTQGDWQTATELVRLFASFIIAEIEKRKWATN